MPRGLYGRLVLSLAVALVLTVVPFGGWLARSQARRLVDATRENALIVTRALAEDTAHFLVIAEYAGLEGQLLEGARLPGVLSIHLIEPNGTLVANVHRDGEAGEVKAFYVSEEHPLPERVEPRVEERAEQLVVLVPIRAGSLLGWLETTWDLGAAEAIRATVLRQMLLLGAAWLAVIVSVVALVLRRPTGAIHAISLFARDLAHRKGERLRVRSGAAEIRLLAGSLDHASVELAQSERALVAERERLAITLQSLGEGVIACDRDGRITLVNGEAERMIARTAGEVLGRPFEEAFRVVDARTGQPLAASLRRAIEDGHTVDPSSDPALVGREGARLRISEQGAPIVDAEGKEIGAVVVFRDETERHAAAEHERELELQLRHAQRMEAIGQLAGGIAHDFNNVLTGILGYGSMLLDLTPKGDARREAAEEVVHAARRASTLTRGLLAFSRKTKAELRPVDLNEVIRGVEKMLQRIIGEDVIVHAELSPGQLVVNADAGQLEQVLVNLATNARDAMPAGGRLTIATTCVELDAPLPVPNGPPLGGRCARIDVTDTGCGMDTETLGRVWEPFFTTKQEGRGTGLGLPIVRGIVQQHGGSLTLESRPGVGTSFHILLPLDAGAPDEAGTGEASSPPGGHERILLVEDEVEVRRVARAILEHAGYQVVEAVNGAEALELLLDGDAPVKLVVSDVVMPRMGGRELRDALRTRQPSLPVLLFSGYTPDLLLEREHLEAGAEVLSKPFTAGALLARARQLLDR
jgi:PAS domain S-box-containing protein